MQSSSPERNFHLELTQANTSFRRLLQPRFPTSRQIPLLIVLDTPHGSSRQQMSNFSRVDSQVRDPRSYLATDRSRLRLEAQNVSSDPVIPPISSSGNIKPQTSTLKLLSSLPRKERVVLFLLANCGHGAVSGADDGFVRQHQNSLEVVL
jgi:hypothetical protein